MIRRYSLHTGITIMALAIGIVGFSMTASAARMTIPRQICDLVIFPFNETVAPITGSTGNQWINRVTNSVCRSHLTIPTRTPYTVRSYSPQPVADSSDIPLKAGAEDKNLPTTLHSHDYFNDSLEDDFYYEAFIAKFAIDFPSDTKNNITDDIFCDTPYPSPRPTGTPSQSQVAAALGDCDGYIAGLWGGTRVEKNSNGVIWTFGIDTPSSKPRIFGQNPTLDPLIGGGFDSTNENARSFGANVNLTTFKVNSPTGAWSATTSSRILIRDFAVLKTLAGEGANSPQRIDRLSTFCANAGDYTRWCSLPTPSGYQSDTPAGGSTANYYWFPIGTVSTVWRSPEPPPGTCQSLNITPSGTYSTAGLPETFSVSMEADPGVNLRHQWTASNSNGLFRFGSTNYTGTPVIFNSQNSNVFVTYLGSNSFTSWTITVNAVNADTGEVYRGPCEKQITIVPEEEQEQPACIDLTVTPTGPLRESDITPFKTFEIQRDFQGDIDLVYRWEANINGVVSFDNQAYNGNPYDDENLITTIRKIGTGPLPSNLILTVTAHNANNRSEAFPQCRQQITITPEQTQPSCVDLTVTPAGPLRESDITPFQTFEIQRDFQGDIDLVYRWEANINGVVSFDNQAYNGNPYDDENLITTIKKIGTDPLPSNLTLTVTAHNANNRSEAFPQCRQQITITPEQTQPSCVDLTVTPAGPLNESALSPFQEFNVTPQIQGNIDLVYRWEASQINTVTFDNRTYNGIPIDDENTLMTVRRTAGSPPLSSNLTLTVTAVNANNRNEEFSQCRQTITITPEESQPSECIASNLTSSGGNPLDVNESSILQSSGTMNVNGTNTNVTRFQWETTNGTFNHFVQNPTFAFCSAFGFGNYPAPCTPIFTGGPAGTVVRATALVENVPSTNPQCTQTITVQEPTQPEAVCTGVTVTPTQLEADGTTTLRARVNFSRPGNYTATIQWQGDGDFDQNSQTSSTSQSTISYPGNTFEADRPLNSDARVFVSSITGAQNSAECQQGVTIEPPDIECEDITAIQKGDQICLEVDGSYAGDFTWRFGGRTITRNPQECVTMAPGTEYEVFATNEPENTLCQLRDRTISAPPQIRKEFSFNGSSWRTGTATMQATQDRVYYRLVFEPGAPRTSATILDPALLDSHLNAQLLPNSPTGITPGTIRLENSLTIVQQGFGIMRQCSAQLPGPGEPSNCYEGGIGPGGIRLVRVNNPVTIEYRGVVESALENPDVCNSQNNICQERYFNQARAEAIRVYAEPDEDGTPSNNFTIFPATFSNPVILNVYCQYILTRAAGDIFLENDLTSGVDIRQCSDFRSTTGVIITPGTPQTPNLVSTGSGESQIFSINHEICTQGQGGTLTGGLEDLYGQGVSKNLSSQICEVKLRTGSPWRQQIITNSIEENKTRASRWEPDAIGNAYMSTLVQTDDKQVYHVSGNLTIPETGYQLFDGEGAKTFIVENGDLIIQGDVTYGACNKQDGPCTVRDIASLAFIVLNGNVYIDPDVKEVAGVFYVQEGSTANSGRIYSGSPQSSDEPSGTQLTVYGSVYGDIDPLFKNRFYAGDPTLDQGGIVIRFDERVILNTPQGLRDILNLDLTQVAR